MTDLLLKEIETNLREGLTDDSAEARKLMRAWAEYMLDDPYVNEAVKEIIRNVLACTPRVHTH
jgi:hypothetical protein